MTQATLYDDDILLWSEQQAEAIRRLGQSRRSLPNELDIENVAEEIESVGRSELAAVESYVELILLHLIKLSANPDAEQIRHWKAEIVAFHGNMRRRYSSSMRQRIDLEDAWRLARTQVITASAHPEELAASLAEKSPISIDELVGREIETDQLSERIRRSVAGI